MTDYAPDTKAAAMAALLQGQSVSAVAKEYDLPKGTVSGWKRQAVRKVAAEGVASGATQKAAEIGDLLTGYLQANLRALQAQAGAFADPVWLSQQKADALAVLHGVMTDKAVRLLEAFGRAEADDGD